MSPTRLELDGTYAKKKFVVRYYQGDRLRGLLLCQQPPRELDAAKKELRRAVEKYLEDPFAEELLRGNVKAGDTVHVAAENGKLVFKAPEPHAAASAS